MKLLGKIVLSVWVPCWIISPVCWAQSLGERDTDFHIGLARHVTKPVGMVAHFTTTSTYPCEGYTLRTQTRWNKDTVTVTVLGLLRPSPCYQTSAEATETVFLGGMNEPVWFFRICYRGDADLYKMVRAHQGLSALPMHTTFTNIRMRASESQ